jgi:hypothetical protein
MMRQPDIRPDYSQERLEEALLLDAAANVRFAREVAVVSSGVFSSATSTCPDAEAGYEEHHDAAANPDQESRRA